MKQYILALIFAACLFLTACEKENSKEQEKPKVPEGYENLLQTANNWKYVFHARPEALNWGIDGYIEFIPMGLRIANNQLALFCKSKMLYQQDYMINLNMFETDLTAINTAPEREGAGLIFFDGLPDCWYLSVRSGNYYSTYSIGNSTTQLYTETMYFGEGSEYILTKSGDLYSTVKKGMFHELTSDDTGFIVYNGIADESTGMKFVYNEHLQELHEIFAAKNGNVIAAVMQKEIIKNNQDYTQMVTVSSVENFKSDSATLIDISQRPSDNLYYVTLYGVDNGNLRQYMYDAQTYKFTKVFENVASKTHATLMETATDGTVYISKSPRGDPTEFIEKYSVGSWKSIPLPDLQSKQNGSNALVMVSLKNDRLFGVILYQSKAYVCPQMTVVEFTGN